METIPPSIAHSEPPPGPAATLIAERYEVLEQLGKGGMGIVYRVRDRRSGDELALKHLQNRDGALGARIHRLFELEYRTLSQLSHPHIVAVRDFGFFEGTPFYTMALLAGQPLSAALPMPWRPACMVLRDVASALSLLHSRRLLHRDVSPANIHLSPDGRATLLDFGTMAAMGLAQNLAGTPPMVPPEALNAQPLDGRADLYALGAVAYRLLTGRHAYPARSFAKLRDLWRSRPASPSSLSPEVPAALSALVMRLLSPDVLGRPATASEVVSQLITLADLPHEPEDQAARGYLLTPNLLGRTAALADFRMRLVQTLRSLGTALLVEGEPGLGCSRMLSRFVLEGRLLALSVIHVDCLEADGDDLGVLENLLSRVRQEVPGADKLLPPELCALDTSGSGITAESLRQLRGARSILVSYFVSLCKRRPLLIAIDNAQLSDRATLAVLTELAAAADRRKLMLVLATTPAPDGRRGDCPLCAFRKQAQLLTLAPLAENETEQMLRSVFGDEPHLKPLAQWTHRRAQGNPRDVMALAQHLVERGAIRYERCRWQLPNTLEPYDAGDVLAEALTTRLSSLCPGALQLAQALSLLDPAAPIAESKYGALLDPELQGDVLLSTDQMLRAGILQPHGDGHAFTQPDLARYLERALPDDLRMRLHQRIAHAYPEPDEPHTVLVASHLQRGGDDDTAAQMLIERARALHLPNAPVAAIPVHPSLYQRAAETYERALAHILRHDAPPADSFVLRVAMIGMGMSHDARLVRHAPPVLDRLLIDTGLCHLDGLPGSLTHAEKLARCFALAAAAHEAAPEPDKGTDPGTAVRAVGRIAPMLTSCYARVLDVENLHKVAQLVAPLRPIAPVLEAITEMVELCVESTSGLDAERRARAILAGDLDESNPFVPIIRLTLCSLLGVWEARLGGTQALARADEIEQRIAAIEEAGGDRPGIGRFRVWHVRMLAYLCNGEIERARYCRDRLELLRLDGRDPQVGPALRTSAYLEARCFALIGSLPGLEAAARLVEEQLDESATWGVVLRWIKAECARLRQQWDRATDLLEGLLDELTAGQHLIWSWAAVSLVEVHIQAGRTPQALELAQSTHRDCEFVGSPPVSQIEHERVLALALAASGQSTQANDRLGALIERASPLLGGVPLGIVYETAARIAMYTGDARALSRYARLTADAFCHGKHPALLARHAKLIEEASRLRLITDSLLPGMAGDARTLARALSDALDEVRSAMQPCSTSEHRAHKALELLTEATAADNGLLYSVDDDEHLQLLAGDEAPTGLQARLQDVLQHEVDVVTDLLGDDDEIDTADPIEMRIEIGGAVYVPVVLRCRRGQQDIIVGVAAVTGQTDQLREAPWQLVHALSDYLVDAGDVVSLIAPGGNSDA